MWTCSSFLSSSDFCRSCLVLLSSATTASLAWCQFASYVEFLLECLDDCLESFVLQSVITQMLWEFSIHHHILAHFKFCLGYHQDCPYLFDSWEMLSSLETEDGSTLSSRVRRKHRAASSSLGFELTECSWVAKVNKNYIPGPFLRTPGSPLAFLIQQPCLQFNYRKMERSLAELTQPTKSRGDGGEKRYEEFGWDLPRVEVLIRQSENSKRRN